MMCCHAGVTMRGHVTCHVMDRDVTHYPSRPVPTRPDPTYLLLTSVGSPSGYFKRQSLRSQRASSQPLTIGGAAR